MSINQYAELSSLRHPATLLIRHARSSSGISEKHPSQKRTIYFCTPVQRSAQACRNVRWSFFPLPWHVSAELCTRGQEPWRRRPWVRECLCASLFAGCRESWNVKDKKLFPKPRMSRKRPSLRRGYAIKLPRPIRIRARPERSKKRLTPGGPFISMWHASRKTGRRGRGRLEIRR